MATTFKWLAFTSRGTGLTTELNALGIGAYSAVGTALDNTTNLDEWGYCDIVLASLLPTAGADLQLFLHPSPDGTTYEDAASTTNPALHAALPVVMLNVSTSAKRVQTPLFRIPPQKFKLVLLNGSGVALNATGNTVTVYTGNEQSV